MKARLLKGFRDYAPGEMLARQAMLDTVRSVFESFGYDPLHTPALEYSDVLLGKYGDDGEKLLYRFLDNGGRDIALRYDLTVPLARFVAMNPNLRVPFRRYQIAPVWRAERPQKGRFREFYQCDVDLIGASSPQADAECILIDCGVMNALGLKDFTIHVNHRGFLDGLLESLQIPAGQTAEVMRTLDKIDKISRDEMARQLSQLGLTETAVHSLTSLADLDGDNRARLTVIAEDYPNSADIQKAVVRLDAVLNLVEAAMPGAPVMFSPALARGLDYYTGIVYETFLPPQYGVGSVMSGGRYDNLLGTMAKREIAAVGISLGIDRLLAALTAATDDSGQLTVTRVLVGTMTGTEDESFACAQKLRDRLPQDNNAVEIFPQPARLKKQFDYANKRKIPFVALIGADEARDNQVTIKNMGTGEQFTGSEKEVVDWLEENGEKREA